jgi:hypothetical protein
METTDILKFIPSSEWSEEQKITVFLQFINVYFVYVFSELGKELSQNAERDLATLLTKKPTATEVMDFYRTLLPNLDDNMIQKAIEFKKIFLLQLYQDKIARLQEKVSTVTPNSPESESLQRNISFWQALHEKAQQDDWAGIEMLLAQQSELTNS